MIDTRLPPSDDNAEMCVLGSAVLSTPSEFDEIRAILEPSDFYAEQNRVVWAALCEMRDAHKPTDGVLLRSHLEEKQQLLEVGGTEYLGRVLTSMPTAAHGAHYAQIVHEFGQRREMIRIANLMLRDAYGEREPATAADIGNAAASAIAKAMNSGTGIGVKSASEAVMLAYEQLDHGGTELIPTGFRDLDEAIGGIGLGEMLIIGARPSMGKSTIARQIAARVSPRFPVALISLEESATKIGRNWFSATAGIDNNRIRRGDNLSREEWEAIAACLPKLGRLPVYIADKAFKMQQIRSVCSLLVSKHGVRLVILDYLQKVQIDGRDRFEKVTNASQELSSLWKELNVAGIVLAQLKREVEQRNDKRPSMSDLRESGQIEQDADCIIFLHREDYYGVSKPDYVQSHEAELIIAKMRDGERGRTIVLESQLNFQRFNDREVGV